MSKGPESRISCASGWRLRCADPYPYSGGDHESRTAAALLAGHPLAAGSIY